jgi:dTDP-4-amino-4,6-dideoxygalactose transaminase
MPAYEKFAIPGEKYEVSTTESARGVCLPSSSFLELHDVQEICRRLELAWTVIGKES